MGAWQMPPIRIKYVIGPSLQIECEANGEQAIETILEHYTDIFVDEAE